MKKLVILGSGGHGRELSEVAIAMQADGADFELLGFVDDDPARQGQECVGYPVLGRESWLLKHRDSVEVVCGLGAPAARHKAVQKLRPQGVRFRGLIHPSVIRSTYLQIDEGVVITAACVLTNNIRLREHVHLNRSVNVGHDCDVGSYVHLAPGVVLSGNVRIGEGCDIGTNAVVIQNLQIGEWTTVGAGAAVVRSLPAHVTAVGVPAKVIRPK